MKRVIVVGSGGAGKSTFSRKLANKTGLELIHLDRLYWRPNWQETPKEEWSRLVSEIVKKPTWILDGNFGGTRDIRIKACDTLIFLDLPRSVCLYRVLKRWWRYRGRNRPDMTEGCDERLDLEFLVWIWNYPNRGRKTLFEEIKAHPEKTVIVLSSQKAVDDFLAAST